MCAGSNSLPSLARTTDSPHPMQQNRLAAFVTVFVAWLRQTPKRLRFGFVRCGGIEPPVPIRRFAPKKRGILILYEGSDWFWSPNPEHRPEPCLALLKIPYRPLPTHSAECKMASKTKFSIGTSKVALSPDQKGARSRPAGRTRIRFRCNLFSSRQAAPITAGLVTG
jgi:hypothetical protein